MRLASSSISSAAFRADKPGSAEAHGQQVALVQRRQEVAAQPQRRPPMRAQGIAVQQYWIDCGCLAP